MIGGQGWNARVVARLDCMNIIDVAVVTGNQFLKEDPTRLGCWLEKSHER